MGEVRERVQESKDVCFFCDGIGAVESVMNKWEEQKNDTKEEVLEFGTSECGTARIFSS